MPKNYELQWLRPDAEVKLPKQQKPHGYQEQYPFKYVKERFRGPCPVQSK